MIKHSHLKVPGGSAHVVENGLEQDPPILFVHGWPQDWSAWTRILELAGRDHRAIAVDLPGIGESQVPAVTTPLLVIRGSKEGSIEIYVNGFRSAGWVSVESAVIPDCGHFAPEEQAELVWGHIEQFADAIPRRAARQATG